jgi:lysophospholipase L1-like esterase
MLSCHRRPTAALLAAALALTAVGQDKPAEDAAVPLQRKDDRSVKLHEGFVERAKKGNVDVLFIGDSITRGWDGAGKAVWAEKFKAWNAANFGIGGDRTQHVLWRVTAGKELDGIDPKVIVMMIGTNNFAANTPEQIADGVKAILAEFKKQKPKAKVLLLGVFPRSAKPGKPLAEAGVKVVAKEDLHPKTAAVNALLAKLADGSAVTYLDIGEKFLDETGGLPVGTMPDYLHLSEKGYAIWADAIAKPVAALLK